MKLARQRKALFINTVMCWMGQVYYIPSVVFSKCFILIKVTSVYIDNLYIGKYNKVHNLKKKYILLWVHAKITAIADEICQMFCERCGDWAEFLQKWMGLARVPLEIGSSGQNSCRSGWDWSEFLQDQVGLVRIPSREGTIDLNSFGSKWVWSEFLQELVGLVRVPLEVSGIGHNSYKRWWNRLEFFLE